jgi:hypothetical protein
MSRSKLSDSEKGLKRLLKILKAEGVRMYRKAADDLWIEFEDAVRSATYGEEPQQEPVNTETRLLPEFKDLDTNDQEDLAVLLASNSA